MANSEKKMKNFVGLSRQYYRVPDAQKSAASSPNPLGPFSHSGSLFTRRAERLIFDLVASYILYMRLREQKSVIRLTPTKVTPSTKMVPMGLNSMLHFSGHLEPSSIDVRAQQNFSFSSQNWPHGSRAETRRENDAKSGYEI